MQLLSLVEATQAGGVAAEEAAKEALGTKTPTKEETDLRQQKEQLEATIKKMQEEHEEELKLQQEKIMQDLHDEGAFGMDFVQEREKRTAEDADLEEEEVRKLQRNAANFLIHDDDDDDTDALAHPLGEDSPQMVED
eukprot:TRINITY_DN14635_c0_g1_i1.p3 TRINITY_DN14635_c0_g1~~TRINITY_DN14635_c0_g1_i1.p3  ORF type:complete len:137 (-),score=71.43 TRINITY_DN14635_c0_g1_i1:959-1369(-)